MANAEHNHELVGDELKIKDAHADEGPTLKRYRPRAMGRATRIRKRTAPPDDHARRRRRPRSHGSESPSRVPARRLHPRLEVELVQRAALLRLPRRGRPHPRPHQGQARPRRPVRHHDPQGRQRGRGQHPHGPAGHRDRQVRQRGRRAAQGPPPDDAASRSRSTSSRSSAPSSTPSSSRSRSPSSCRTASRSGAR